LDSPLRAQYPPGTDEMFVHLRVRVEVAAKHWGKRGLPRATSHLTRQNSTVLYRLVSEMV